MLRDRSWQYLCVGILGLGLALGGIGCESDDTEPEVVPPTGEMNEPGNLEPAEPVTPREPVEPVEPIEPVPGSSGLDEEPPSGVQQPPAGQGTEEETPDNAQSGGQGDIDADLEPIPEG